MYKEILMQTHTHEVQHMTDSNKMNTNLRALLTIFQEKVTKFECRASDLRGTDLQIGEWRGKAIAWKKATWALAETLKSLGVDVND